MKTSTHIKKWSPVILLLSLVSFWSCEDKVELTMKYTVYEPVYMPLSELREAVEVTEPQILQNTGKLYLYNDLILINDPGKGIHIIDNSDQTSPTPVSYINIPGNSDFSVRGDILYADSYMDLVLLDISDPSNISETGRIEDIFTDFIMESGFYLDPDSGIVVDYRKKEVIEVTEEKINKNYYPDIYFYRGAAYDMAAYASSGAEFMAAPASSSVVPVGISGSLATFTIVNSHLYVLDNNNMITFDISNPENVTNVDILDLGWGIETIFPYKENIFVGSQNGMYIIDNADQDNPELISIYSHIVSCDPVVVQDDKAYVTLRGGSDCRGGSLNLLEVVDLSDLNNPHQITSYNMLSPYGLGIDGDALFVCEGEHGFKVFDASDDQKIEDNMLLHISNIHAYDVIPYQNTLYLIGNDGLYQYNYSDRNDITLISKLSVDNSSLEL